MGVRRAKVAIFAVSGFIAGCAGALFGGISGAVGGTSFEPVRSLVIVLFAFVGGITTVPGALFAGPLFALPAYVEQTFPDRKNVVKGQRVVVAVYLDVSRIIKKSK